MKTHITLVVLLVLLLLSGCGGQIPAAAIPEATEQSHTAAHGSTVPETTTPPETEENQSTGPQYAAPIPGYYLVSSVGRGGDVTFYSTADPANGFLVLEEDGTGQMSFGGTEGPLTWNNEVVYWEGQILPCMSASYYDAELGREEVMLIVYFLDTQTSLILRPAEVPTGECTP